MNFTDNYIEMCINNVNIQNLCRHNKGDWFWNGEKPYLYCKSGLGSSNPHDYKWLPTLEDLIWMIDKDIEESNLEDFMMWCRLFVTPENIKENALEYIMEVHYSKEWNPEKKEWEETNGS